MRRDHVFRLTETLFVFGAYLGMYALTFALNLRSEKASLLFLPAGVALGRMALFGRHVGVGVFCAELLATRLNHFAWPATVASACADTFQAFVGATLLRHHFDPRLESVRPVGRLLAVAVTVAAIPPSITLPALLVGAPERLATFWQAWGSWWAGDLMGILVVAPLMLVWGTPSSARPTRQSAFELLLIVVALVVVCQIPFGGPSFPDHRPLLSFLPFPFVVLAALRCGQHGATAAMAVASFVAAYATANDYGPFAIARTMPTNFLAQYVFSATAVTTALLLAATVRERQRGDERRRRLEGLMLEQQRLEALGRMAGGVAHDFNNLLTAVLGNLELARGTLPANSEAVGLLRNAEDAARRAAALTAQIHAYTGLSRGDGVRVRLHRLVQETAELLRTVVPRKVAFVFDLDETIPKLRANGPLIRDALTNLVVNAGEAIVAATGTITVRTALEQVATPSALSPFAPADVGGGTFLRLEVLDTGCGMDSATLRHAFDPFFTTKFTGRGLGLSAVLGLARAHDGFVAAASEPGRGCRVAAYLRFQPAVDSTPDPTPSPTRLPSLGRGTALVVEDEESVRAVVVAALRRGGWRTLIAGDGEEALEKLREGSAVDFVLLDLTMPRRGGLEILDELRELRPGVPVLLMSGLGQGEMDRHVAERGLAGALHKPFSPNELLKAVEGYGRREVT